jgi:uncharacterized protein YaeQ
VALQATRLSYQIALSHLERRRQLEETVIVARHPSETQEHVCLRVLAWCLLNQDGLRFGKGLSDPEAADLWAHDETGRLLTWIECGSTQAEKLRKVQRHNAGAVVAVVLDDERRANQLVAALAESRNPRGSEPPTLWLVTPELVAELAAREELRQRWTVTVLEEHLYMEVGGQALDSAIVRIAGATE